MKDVLETEEAVHDAFSRSFDLQKVLVDEYFTVPTCPENRFILEKLPDLKGKRILDIGTGTGESAVFFAKRGAIVTAIDISEGMLAVAQELATIHQVKITTLKMDGGDLKFPGGSFDIVYAANVLHHIDTKSALERIRDILTDDGVAAFWDPIRYNPIINVYRVLAHQVRSPDEHPLARQDLHTMQTIFRDVEYRFFWICTLGIFLKYYLYDMIHPNEERYWKKIIYDYKSVQKIYRPLEKLDSLLTRVPGVRWLAWNMAVVVRK